MGRHSISVERSQGCWMPCSRSRTECRQGTGRSWSKPAAIDTWRRRQIAALVRDAPDEAVRVLTSLNYRVTAPESGERVADVDMLRRW